MKNNTITLNDTQFTISGRAISYESPATGEIETINLDYRDGQKAFAALNVDYDIERFAPFFDDEDMETAYDDCKTYHWV